MCKKISRNRTRNSLIIGALCGCISGIAYAAVQEFAPEIRDAVKPAFQRAKKRVIYKTISALRASLGALQASMRERLPEEPPSA